MAGLSGEGPFSTGRAPGPSARVQVTSQFPASDGETAAIVACLDATASGRPVLEWAVRLGELLGWGVGTLHVGNPGASAATPADLAARRGVPLRLLEGPVDEQLLSQLGAPGVQMAVMGARSTVGGRRPVGTVTRHVIQAYGRPVLIVPPEAVGPGPLKSALVPVEGTAQTSGPLDRWLPRLAGQLALIGLHVFTPGRTPAMLDRPVRDMLLLTDAFKERHLPAADRLEVRSGHVASHVVQCSRELAVDLIILSWTQPGDAGRAETVLQVLALSPVPTLLLPGRAPGS